MQGYRDIRAKWKRFRRLMSSDIWDVELSSLSRVRQLGARTLRVVHLVLKGFLDDECPLHAAALTFNTIMAVVPILALSLALARGFGSEDMARQRIREAVAEWTSTFSMPARTNQVSAGGATEVENDGSASSAGDANVPPDGPPLVLAEEIDGLVDTAFEKVENISFAALGGVGLVLLLWMVVAVLGRVEAAFNRVWGVSSGRPLWRKFTDYLSAVFILPFLTVLATSLPVVDFATRYANDETATFIRALLGLGMLKDVTVFVMTALTFTFVFMFMPNTKVKFGAGILGGAVAAALFLTWLGICAGLQGFVTRYGRIYGSFAVVPILLAWVHVSWQIVLFGAEMAFAIQNAETYRMEQGGARASAEARVLLGLSLLRAAAEAMLGDGEPFTLTEYARRHKVPVRLLNSVIDELRSLGYVGEIFDRPGSLVLLRSPEHTAVGDVVEAMLRSGTQPGGLGMASVESAVHQAVQRAVGGMQTQLSEMTVRDLSGTPVGDTGTAQA